MKDLIERAKAVITEMEQAWDAIEETRRAKESPESVVVPSIVETPTEPIVEPIEPQVEPLPEQENEHAQ